jgi:hypothetical protein
METQMSESVDHFGRYTDRLGLTNPDELFTFTWEGSFHLPFRIRAGKQANIRRVSASYRLSLFGDEHVVSRSLSRSDWNRIRNALDAVSYWSLPQDPLPRRGLDGATWTIEASRGSRDHRIEFWGPEVGPFRDLGLLFVELAVLPLSDDEVY